MIIVTDGRRIQCRYPGGRSQWNYDPDSLIGPAAVNLESICFWDGERQLSTRKGGNMHDSKLVLVKGASWNGKIWNVLEESAPTMGVFVQYYIEPRTSLIWRTVVQTVDRKRIRSEYAIQSIELDVPLQKALFKIE
jgi:hypothetical protein